MHSFQKTPSMGTVELVLRKNGGKAEWWTKSGLTFEERWGPWSAFTQSCVASLTELNGPSTFFFQFVQLSEVCKCCCCCPTKLTFRQPTTELAGLCACSTANRCSYQFHADVRISHDTVSLSAPMFATKLFIGSYVFIDGRQWMWP